MLLLTRFTPYYLLFLTSLIGLIACQKQDQEPGQISRITLKVATPYLNTNTDLPLFWEMADQTGRLMTPPVSPEVYADGVLLANPGFYQQARPGPHVLEAHWGTVSSPPLSLTVRSQQAYPLVRLPIIYHLAKHLATRLSGQQLQTILNAANVLYRNQGNNPDPNQADSFIEFYPAANDPFGTALAQPGVHPLDFDDPSTDEGSKLKVDSLLQHWCVKQYVNVFVGIDWSKAIYAGKYNYSYYPPTPGGVYPSDLACGMKVPIRAAISLLEASMFEADIVAHELGHMLGLRHTFGDCEHGPVDVHVLDTPRQPETHPDADGRKFSCNRVYFRATNVMDYYNQRLGFTQDQVAVMRSILEYPVYLPLSGAVPLSPGNGRISTLVSEPVTIVVE